MSSPEPNLADNWQFTELWVDPTASPPYVLILLGDSSGNSSLYDPAQNYHIVFASSSYEEAKFWLLEDECERVERRLQVEAALPYFLENWEVRSPVIQSKGISLKSLPSYISSALPTFCSAQSSQ